MKDFERVSPKAKAKWRLTRIIGLALLLLISAAAWLASGSTAVLIACGAAVLVQLINIIVYPIIEYIQWSYRIGDDCIEIKKGIFWRSYTVIPISRIQHVSASSGPIERMFKLASVSIYTAGGIHGINELDAPVADDICLRLQNVVNRKVAARLAAQEAQSVGSGANGGAEQ